MTDSICHTVSAFHELLSVFYAHISHLFLRGGVGGGGDMLSDYCSIVVLELNWSQTS